MFDLKKVEFGFKDCRDPREIEHFLLEDGAGDTFARVNKHHSSLVNVTVSNILPEEISGKFTQLLSVLRGKCHTIKFFFESEEGNFQKKN